MSVSNHLKTPERNFEYEETDQLKFIRHECYY